MNKTTNRGGRREGAGRRPKDSSRVNLTVRVSPETRIRIAELRKKGVLIGKHIDAMVDSLYLSTKNPNNL